MKLSNAAELISKTIQKFGNIPNKKVITYKIVKSISYDAEAYINGRTFHMRRSLRYEGIIRFERATVLKATKSQLICLTLHELAHSAPKAIAERKKEQKIKKHLRDVLGKEAVKEVCWSHSKIWRRSYRSLIKGYRVKFPGVLKAKDVIDYS
jgi:hypothetical protein